MESQKNQRAVEDRLREAVKQDRARIQIGRISRFGLLELSRQRLRPSISESTNIVCPRCSGMGVIRSVESLALAILRLIGEEARKDRTAKVIAQLPVDVATYLMNEKRDWLNNIETRSSVDIVLVPNRYLDTPAYEIRRVRDDELGLPENTTVSHELAVQPQIDLDAVAAEQKAPPPPTPAVTSVVPSTPAPPAPEPVIAATAAAAPAVAVPQFGPRDGIFVRFWHWLFGDKRAPEPVAARGEQRSERDVRHDGRHAGRGARPDHRRDPRRDDRRPGRRDEHRREMRGGERRDGERTRHGGDGRRDSRRGHGETQRDHRRPEAEPGRAAAASAAPASPRRDDAPGGEQVRNERPEGERGERGGRRSRRGGRRRRREQEDNVAGSRRDGAGGNGAQEDSVAAEPASSRIHRPARDETVGTTMESPRGPAPDFGRPASSPPADVAAAQPAPSFAPAQPRGEWTPSPPSDATREGPLGEP
jgi:ribonuclease E